MRVGFANTPDGNAGFVKTVLPDSGAVVGDKGFVGSICVIEEAGLHSMVIYKNNMKDKNKEKDRFITKLRSPFRGLFSKQQKRVRHTAHRHKIRYFKIQEFENC